MHATEQMDLKHLTRQELLDLVPRLLAESSRAQKEVREILVIQEELVRNLQLHQIELETQNRDLREAQTEIEQSRNRYADLFELAPLAYVSFDRRGVVLEANMTAATLMGRKRDEVSGFPFTALVQLRETQTFYLHLEACARSQSRVTGELQILVRNRAVFLHVVTMPQSGDAGEVVGFRSVFVDITLQKEAERDRNAALASEQVLRARLEALDRATLGLTNWLARGDRANPNDLLQLIAVEASAVSGSDQAHVTVSIRYAGDEPLTVELGNPIPGHLEHVIESAEITYGEKKLGTLRIVRVPTTQARRDYERQTLKMLADRVGWAVEISRLNQIESRQRSHLDLLSRASGELTECVDMDATVTALARIPTLITSELAVWCSVHLPAQEQGTFRLCAFAAASEDDLPFHPNFELATREPESLLDRVASSGRLVIVQASELLVRASSPSDLHLRKLVTSLDLGAIILVPMVARTKALGLWCIGIGKSQLGHEREHAACFEELALRCAFALDNANLFEDLTSAVQSRDNLLATVSHDLRTPLNAIALTARTLAPLPDQQDRRRSRKQVDLISRSVGHMSHLLNDLLTAGTLDGGRLTINVRPEDPTALLKEVLQVCEPIVQAKSLRFEQVESHAHEVPHIMVDWNRMIQVFSNLVGNAVKFTEPGGCIHIGAVPEGEFVRFWVTDTGMGIPTHKLANVFDRYWTRDKHARGLGLGLFICRGIVETHGGRMKAESKVGEGSTFSFTIPTCAAARS
jgi:PAS domain S-box-containing protein